MAGITKRERTNRKIAQAVSKMTDETVRKLEEVFAIDGTVEEACYYAGISRETYYRWIKENEKLRDRFEALRNRPILKARQTVVKSLDDPNHAFKYLEKKRKREFGNTLEVDLNAKVTISKILNDIENE